jgi:hypothetical protein
MANTVIQLKYSNVTGTPPSLNLAEPAYSNVSNKLWIDDGSGVVAIGGKYYTQLIDAATSAATQNTIVRRDTSGNFSANDVTVTSLTSTGAVTQNGVNLGAIAQAAYDQANTAIIAGGQVAGGYANSAYAQANTALQYATSAGSYANSAYSEANNATSLSNDALQHASSAGTYANAAYLQANTATTNAATADQKAVSAGVYANAAYAHANTRYASTGGTISGDVTVTGNLTVSGNVVTVEASNLSIEDNMIYLNKDANVANPDLGIAAAYDDGTYQHTGLFRDQSDGIWKFYDGYTLEPDASIYIDTNHASFRLADLTANIITDVMSVRGYDPINHANNAFAAANTAKSYADSAYAQANTATTNAATADQRAVTSGVYANSAYIQANTGTTLAQAAYDAANTALGGTATDGWARGVANSASSHANSSYDQANTATTLAQAAFDVANTDLTFISAASGSYGSATAVPTFNLEANGRISSITTTTIALDTSALTSGTLGVARGGTGNTAFTSNHVILGNGTGGLTTTGSSTEGHILTINSSGVPTFQYLNGGTF